MSRTDPRRVWELALQAMNQDYPVYLRALKSPQTVACETPGAVAPGWIGVRVRLRAETAMYLRVHEDSEHRRTRAEWRAVALRRFQQRPAISTMNVAFQLLDQVLLVVDDCVDQIADGHQTDEFAVVDHRQVPDAVAGHQRQSGVGRGPALD